MADPQTTIQTANWWGRRSADSATIYCAQNGWREATWRRDRKGKWQEIDATIRPVVSIDHIGNVTLGEPRKVK